MASDRTKYVAMNLLPHHLTKLDELVAASGTNRNNLLRCLIMALQPEDIEKLLNR